MSLQAKVRKVNDVFIQHSDVQMVLSMLSLPMIGSLDNQGQAIQIEDDVTSAIVIHVPDGDSSRGDAQRERLRQAGGELSGQAGMLVPVLPTTSDIVLTQQLFEARRPSLATLCQLAQEHCEAMTHGRLSVVALQLSKELEKQINRNKELQASKRQLKRSLDSTVVHYEKRLKQQEPDFAKSSLELTTSGKTGKRLDARSILALGLRRNFSNIAAADFGTVVLRDLSASTVLRSETRCAAALVMDMRCFCNSCVPELVLSPSLQQIPPLSGIADSEVASISSSPLPWNLVVVSFRSDATNSSVWRREKLHVLDVNVGVVKKPVQPGGVSHPEDTLSWLSTKYSLRQDLTRGLLP